MTYIQHKKPRWTTGRDLIASFQYRTGLSGDRMSILAAAWSREAGHLSGHWELVGFKGGTLYVKPRSAAAAQELQLRGSSLVRGLNKYFNRPWIRSLKVAPR